MGALSQIAQQVAKGARARVEVARVQAPSTGGIQLKGETKESLRVPRVLGDEVVLDRLRQVALETIFGENGMIQSEHGQIAVVRVHCVQ